MKNQWERGNFACVELNPVWDQMPDCVKDTRHFLRPEVIDTSITGIAAVQIRFCMGIVAKTGNTNCAYRLKAETFRLSGGEGRYALSEIIRNIHFIAPEALVLYDARYDQTSAVDTEYIHDAFDVLGVDMVVINPVLDEKILRLLSLQKGKGVVVQCHNVVKGSEKFVMPQVGISLEEVAVLRTACATYSHAVDDATKNCSTSVTNHLACRIARDWNMEGDCVVALDTKFPHELRQIRGILGDVPVLSFGTCAQDSDLEQTINAAKDSHGQGVIVNLPSGLVFSSPEDDYAKVAGKIATDLSAKIRKCCGAES